ncbi:MAG: BLUF domain-containing protein [Methylophaga sp.]|nr:BLUF domain-containing protein [Methylophaga sp.]
MDRDLYKIMYISSATQDMSSNELESLMVKCREKNAFFDITGYMVYHEGSIIQLLEGSRTSVNYIYNTIKLDSRHHEIIELCAAQIERRAFADWQMGFKKIERQQIQKVNTIQDLFQGELSLPQLEQFCGRAALFFETFLKVARLDNYSLLQNRMSVL